MPLIKRSDVPDYLQNSQLYRSLDRDDDASFFVPFSCFPADSSGVNSTRTLSHILNTMRFWILEYPPRGVLAYILTNEVEKYESTHPTVWSLLCSFRFGKEFLKVKALPSHKRIEFAIKSRFLGNIVDDLFALGHCLPQNTCTLAVVTNRLDLLRLGIEDGCRMSEHALFLAAINSKVEMLRYAHSCGVVLSPNLSVATAKRGQLQCLELLHEIGVEFDVNTCAAAAGAGNLECLQYVHQHNAGMDAKVVVQAARSDKLSCMKYAVQHGAALTEEVTYIACVNNSIDCLRYALEVKCPINTDAMIAAARVGAFDCLLVAHRMGAPWDENVCAEAALHGHLHCLSLAHQLGCPWDEKTIANAVWSGHWECRSYAVRNGCAPIAHGVCILCCVYSCCILPFGIYIPSARDPVISALIITNGIALSTMMGVYAHLLQRRWPCINWNLVRVTLNNCVAGFALGCAVYVACTVLYMVYLIVCIVVLGIRLLSAYALWYLAEQLVDFAESEESMLF